MIVHHRYVPPFLSVPRASGNTIEPSLGLHAKAIMAMAELRPQVRTGSCFTPKRSLEIVLGTAVVAPTGSGPMKKTADHRCL